MLTSKQIKFPAEYFILYHSDTSDQRKPQGQGYISHYCPDDRTINKGDIMTRPESNMLKMLPKMFSGISTFFTHYALSVFLLLFLSYNQHL